MNAPAYCQHCECDTTEDHYYVIRGRTRTSYVCKRYKRSQYRKNREYWLQYYQTHKEQYRASYVRRKDQAS